LDAGRAENAEYVITLCVVWGWSKKIYFTISVRALKTSDSLKRPLRKNVCCWKTFKGRAF